jgi:hypothetical protein
MGFFRVLTYTPATPGAFFFGRYALLVESMPIFSSRVFREFVSTGNFPFLGLFARFQTFFGTLGVCRRKTIFFNSTFRAFLNYLQGIH